jgi:hypothetical protein
VTNQDPYLSTRIPTSVCDTVYHYFLIAFLIFMSTFFGLPIGSSPAGMSQFVSLHFAHFLGRPAIRLIH